MERAFCLLILSNLLLSDGEFIFWAELSTKNAILNKNTISISKAMVKTSADTEFLCELVPNENLDPIVFLNTQKSELLECFAGEKVKLKDYSKYAKNGSDFLTNLKLQPVRFVAKFKPNLTIIEKFKGKR